MLTTRISVSRFRNSSVRKFFLNEPSHYMSWFWYFYRQSYMIYKLSLFDPILRWWRHNMRLGFQDFEKIVSYTNTSSESSFYLWLSPFYHHWCMRYKFGFFWPNFELMTSPLESKLAVFWESDLINELHTWKFHQIFILIFLSPSIHGIQLSARSIQFWDNDVTKEINVPEFWKSN